MLTSLLARLSFLRQTRPSTLCRRRSESTGRASDASRSSTAANEPGATSSCASALPRIASPAFCVAAAAAMTDSKMRMNPVQRQRLPASPSRISAMRWLRIVGEQMRGRHQHPGVQMPHCAPPHCRNACCSGCNRRPRKSFDSLDVRAFRLQHGNEAAVHQFAIHAHRARAAFAFAASFLGSGQLKVFAQHVEKPLHRQARRRRAFAVYSEFECGHAALIQLPAPPLFVRTASFANRSSGSSGIELKPRLSHP